MDKPHNYSSYSILNNNNENNKNNKTLHKNVLNNHNNFQSIYNNKLLRNNNTNTKQLLHNSSNQSVHNNSNNYHQLTQTNNNQSVYDNSNNYHQLTQTNNQSVYDNSNNYHQLTQTNNNQSVHDNSNNYHQLTQTNNNNQLIQNSNQTIYNNSNDQITENKTPTIGNVVSAPIFTNNMINNTDKFHFFIGHMLNDISVIKQLFNLRKKFKNKYKMKEVHWNNKFFVNMIYLGYFDMATANIYMEYIMTPLIKALTEKINSLNSTFTQYKLMVDTSFYNLSVKLTDDNNILDTVIIPYLFENGILPVYTKKKTQCNPYISLLHYKSSIKLKSKKDIKIPVPMNVININSISLIKGTPIKYRPGTPSIHDQLNIEEVVKYNLR